jgi:hypothetical protein
MLDNIIFNLKRIRTEIISIAIVSLLILFLPSAAQSGLMALFITKALFVTLGVLYAHGSRKFLFPYIDMRTVIEGHNLGAILFLMAWYGVIVWAFAVGG